MHEQALMQDLRRMLEEVAEREHALRVVKVRVWVGALSHLTEQSLRSMWPDVVRDGPAASSRLEVETSHDVRHPDAQAVVLRSVVLSEAEVSP